MNKEKLILPVSIISASIILGGFLYAIQANKQQSIERQQAADLAEKRRVEEKEQLDSLTRIECAANARQMAVELNREACSRGEYCLRGEGMYLVGQYDNAYNACLQSYGLK